MANDLSIPNKYKNKKIYSYSKLSSLKECKYAYYLQRIKKVKTKNNIWGITGGNVHNLLEDLQQNKINIEDAKKRFLKELDEMKMIVQFPTEQMENNYVKNIIHYLDNYEKVKCKDYKIELKEFLNLGEIVLIMFLDLVIRYEDDVTEIRDYKTSSKFSKNDLKEKSKQLILYAMTLKQNYKKINDVKISYDMLKYVVVRHNNKGRSKVVERCKLVVELQDKIEKDLLNLGLSELETNEIILNAIIKNEIPIQVKENFEIKPYILYVDYNEEDEKELLNWIYNSVQEIENEIEWKPKEIDKNSEFFCNNLCSVSHECKYWNEYLNNKNEIEEENIKVSENLF